MGLLCNESDNRLLAMARAGNHAAFSELVRRYRGALVGYARRIVRSEELAEDAVQQSLLQAWSALQRQTGVNHVKPWLYRIVCRTAVRLREAANDAGAELDETLIGSEAPHRELEQRFAVRQTLEGIAALPELQREALLLTVIGGTSHDRAATRLGVSADAVRGLVHRARVTLRSRAAAAIGPFPLIGWMIHALRNHLPLMERSPDADVALRGAGFLCVMCKAGALVAGATAMLAGGVALHARLHAAVAASPRPPSHNPGDPQPAVLASNSLRAVAATRPHPLRVYSQSERVSVAFAPRPADPASNGVGADSFSRTAPPTAPGAALLPSNSTTPAVPSSTGPAASASTATATSDGGTAASAPASSDSMDTQSSNQTSPSSTAPQSDTASTSDSSGSTNGVSSETSPTNASGSPGDAASSSGIGGSSADATDVSGAAGNSDAVDPTASSTQAG